MKAVVTVICLISIVWISACNTWTGRPEDPFEYDGEQYERVDLDYKVYGDRDTVLLFIHGWNLNQTYWGEHVTHFAEGYKVVTLDLAGHGDSGRNRSNWTAESFAKDIGHIIRSANLEHIVIVGHQIGGQIALQLYDQFPDRIISIIGVECFRDVEFELTEQYLEKFETYHNRFKRDYSTMADELARSSLRSTKRDVIKRVVKDYRSSDPRIALPILKYMLPKYEEDKQRLRQLPFPLRIIASDHEPVNEAALKTYAKTGYTIKWIYGAGGFPMVEQPEQFNTAVSTHLKAISRQ